MTSTESMSAQGSPFWRFSLGFYRQPGVADACIILQEEAGVDVNLLLFLLWRATEHRAFSPDEVEQIDNRVAPWRELAVIPLRAVRRALRAPPALMTSDRVEAFRNRIKAVELEAERLQQEAMFDVGEAPPQGRLAPSIPEAARTNVTAYETMRGVSFPPRAVSAIFAAFDTHAGALPG